MQSNNDRWTVVTKALRCPACGHTDWCAWTPDGARLKCERSTKAPSGMKKLKDSDGGAIFTVKNLDAPRAKTLRKVKASTSSNAQVSTTREPKSINWSEAADRYQHALAEPLLLQLADSLGVTPSSLKSIGAGWVSRDGLRSMKASGANWHDEYPDGAYCFPERDGHGRVVGLSLRTTDGRKGSPSGAVGGTRGLIVPSSLKDRPDPVLIVEGASDVAACEVLQLAAVGRPSNTGGADELARLLEGREVIVVGERDGKSDGRWPGRDGAKAVANKIAASWQQHVGWTMPPQEIKDIRAFLQDRVSKGLDLNDVDACGRAGAELLAQLKGNVADIPPESKPRQAELVVQLALEMFRLGRSDTGEPFAVAHERPGHAHMLQHDAETFRSLLACSFRRKYRSSPTLSAINDALTILRGEAMDQPKETVWIRTARYESGIVVDLGDESGRVVIVTPGEWKVVNESPVLFRRTRLTDAMPEPTCGGSIGHLKNLINVKDDCWPVLVGWMVSAFFPDIPHPVMLIGGQQGSGKSTAARMILSLIDPSPAPLRTQPNNEENWAVASSASWAMGIDNISTIPDWWSDALCKVSTGDGRVARQRFTDCAISVIAFRRVVLLTSIDPGALRGDLGDRILLMDSRSIDGTQRRTESELNRLHQTNRSMMFGGLLDLVAGTLLHLDQIQLEVTPRMADFARLLAALDKVDVKSDDGLKGDALEQYLAQRTSVAMDVVESDDVASAIRDLAEEVQLWSGTQGKLLQRITPKQKPRNWPESPRKLRSHLNRIMPALSQTGVIVKIPEGRTRDGRVITIEYHGE